MPDAAEVTGSTGLPNPIVVGLGNPGERYALTRHNVGAMAVQDLAAADSVRLAPGRGQLGRVHSATTRIGDRRVVLATLSTFMNESGQAVAPLVRYYKTDPAALIVIHDELDLPYGTVRIKQGGGDNGHNGLRSVTRSLGTPDYVRIRVGIGRPSGLPDPADYVLRPFGPAERRDLGDVLIQASQAVSLLVLYGVSYTQNAVHGS